SERSHDREGVIGKHLGELRQDVRFGRRMLARAPGFTAVALISLTLGIGVATSAFSELNGFVLRDVPAVVRPGDLVTLQAPVSYPDYQRYRDRNDLFSGWQPVPTVVLSLRRGCMSRFWRVAGFAVGLGTLCAFQRPFREF